MGWNCWPSHYWIILSRWRSLTEQCKLMRFYGQDFLYMLQVLVSQFQNEVYIYTRLKGNANWTRQYSPRSQLESWFLRGTKPILYYILASRDPHEYPYNDWLEDRPNRLGQEKKIMECSNTTLIITFPCKKTIIANYPWKTFFTKM